MAIPGTLFHTAPPPLPPPKMVDAELGWRLTNRDFHGSQRHLAPIKTGSSLYGSYRQPIQDDGDTSDQETEDASAMDTSEDTSRRGSGVSSLRSPSQAEKQLKPPFANLFRRSPSPSLASQRLHGEKLRARENFSQSSQAYDRGVLLKIGKPPSPQRHGRPDSVDASGTAGRSLSFNTKPHRPPPLSPRAHHHVGPDSRSQWTTSPPSAGVSPASRPGWTDYNLNFGTSPGDGSSLPMALDTELLGGRIRPGARLSISGSNSASHDITSTASYSHRASHDHSITNESDLPFSREENPSFRYHPVGDVTSLQTSPKQGMKRRAPSPSPDGSRENRPSSPRAPQPKSLAPKHTWSTSPRYANTKLGSSSSTASSARHNSYSSSLVPSLASSSLTTISTSDKTSPANSLQRLPSVTSAPQVDVSVPAMGPVRNQLSLGLYGVKPDSRKMSTRNTVNDVASPPLPSRLGHYFICSCCPKKPKKFDTEEDLEAHQMEKQYTCQYCNNRFKNKNEAERHQNSLHLRRHSWSCAAITSFQAAFHGSSSPKTQSPTAGPSTDTCGFCGEEFPNHPAPDWDRRVEHLMNVHKFGECNQAKKFFRADHFRQHLKHSHAGQSGKWTNILENVCLRDEGLDPATGSTDSASPGPMELSNSYPGSGLVPTTPSGEHGSVSPKFSEKSYSPTTEGGDVKRSQRDRHDEPSPGQDEKFASASEIGRRKSDGGSVDTVSWSLSTGTKGRRASGALSEILISQPGDATVSTSAIESRSGSVSGATSGMVSTPSSLRGMTRDTQMSGIALPPPHPRSQYPPTDRTNG